MLVVGQIKWKQFILCAVGLAAGPFPVWAGGENCLNGSFGWICVIPPPALLSYPFPPCLTSGWANGEQHPTNELCVWVGVLVNQLLFFSLEHLSCIIQIVPPRVWRLTISGVSRHCKSLSLKCGLWNLINVRCILLLDSICSTRNLFTSSEQKKNSAKGETLNEYWWRLGKLSLKGFPSGEGVNCHASNQFSSSQYSERCACPECQLQLAGARSCLAWQRYFCSARLLFILSAKLPAASWAWAADWSERGGGFFDSFAPLVPHPGDHHFSRQGSVSFVQLISTAAWVLPLAPRCAKSGWRVCSYRAHFTGWSV